MEKTCCREKVVNVYERERITKVRTKVHGYMANSWMLTNGVDLLPATRSLCLRESKNY